MLRPVTVPVKLPATGAHQRFGKLAVEVVAVVGTTNPINEPEIEELCPKAATVSARTKILVLS